MSSQYKAPQPPPHSKSSFFHSSFRASGKLLFNNLLSPRLLASQHTPSIKMKHTTTFVAAIGLASTVAAVNSAANDRPEVVQKRSVPLPATQHGNKRVEPRSPERWAYPGPREQNVEGGASAYGLKDQAVDTAYDIGAGYLKDKTGFELPGRSGSGSTRGQAPRNKRNRKRAVIEPRAKSSRGGGKSNSGGRGGEFMETVKDTAIDEGIDYIEGELGMDLPDRREKSSSGSSGSSRTSWPWSNRKREVTVDEVVEEVLDQMNQGEKKSDDETADALKEIIEDATKEDDNRSISDVVEALTDASDDTDSKSEDDSNDVIEKILDAASSDDKDDEGKDEDTLSEKIEELVNGESDSKSSHGDTLEEKLEELEKETSALDKDDPKAEMIDELIDELIDEAATLDEIPVEYFQYWMAVQSCLDPVHLLTTKGLMASHLSRRGTTPIIVNPTRTVKREEAKPAEVNLGLAQPFGAEMAQTSGAGDGLLGRGTVGYLVFGVAAAFLVRGVAF
ncbi:hypothetical protein QBC41DRAFT_331809 [Cercophora samala]|uniref:Uncharacterized protein n=1 Tax=Cercophora samala TaxID=330535 RepID=A0AA39YUM9_9PEZI|nr:hypothetical protein QBC41DRAFT_331809 [Cercophora samala]